MKTQTVAVPCDDLTQLKNDVALIKNLLLDEGPLTDWAKNELEESRMVTDSELLSSKEVRQMILDA